MLLTVERLVVGVFLHHYIGHHADVGLETVVLPGSADDPLMAALAGHLRIDMHLDFILNGQLDQLFTRVLAHADQRGMIRAARTNRLGWLDRMLNTSTRQMRRESPSTLGTSLALVILVPGCAGGLGGRVLFGLLFFGLRRGIPGPFLRGHLLSSFLGRLTDPCLQLLRVDLLRTRTKEVPLVNRDPVLEVAPKLLQFLHPALQCLILGL